MSDPSAFRHVAGRSADWAQVYPEWGLAGNAALVAPREVSSGKNLQRRVFLHSYSAEVDPDGSALETILTAPLVVAQWINCQYYFSTVAPEVFGAGTKTIHNVVGTAGVIAGHEGDLRLGLPWQSVATSERLVHEPMRLLAVIQAPGQDRHGGRAQPNPAATLRQWMAHCGRAGERGSAVAAMDAGGLARLDTADGGNSQPEGDDSMTTPTMSKALTKMIKIEVVVAAATHRQYVSSSRASARPVSPACLVSPDSATRLPPRPSAVQPAGDPGTASSPSSPKPRRTPYCRSAPLLDASSG